MNKGPSLWNIANHITLVQGNASVTSATKTLKQSESLEIDVKLSYITIHLIPPFQSSTIHIYSIHQYLNYLSEVLVFIITRLQPRFFDFSCWVSPNLTEAAARGSCARNLATPTVSRDRADLATPSLPRSFAATAATATATIHLMGSGEPEAAKQAKQH